MTLAPSDRRYILIYDGGCAVCRRLVARVAKWDAEQSLEIVAAQDPEVPIRFPWIPARALLESMQLVRRSDRVTWQGAAAIEELLRNLPKARVLTWLFRIPFVRPLAERLYGVFARNRYRLGCGAHCDAERKSI